MYEILPPILRYVGECQDSITILKAFIRKEYKGTCLNVTLYTQVNLTNILHIPYDCTHSNSQMQLQLCLLRYSALTYKSDITVAVSHTSSNLF